MWQGEMPFVDRRPSDHPTDLTAAFALPRGPSPHASGARPCLARTSFGVIIPAFTEDSLVAREVSLVNAGVMTPNEVRARHGLGAEAWGEGPRSGV